MSDTDTQIAELEERATKGIAWLAEHDPAGGQYFRVKAGLTRLSAMPGLTDDERAEWIRWYDNYRLFEQLMSRLDRLTSRREQAS